LQPHHKRLDLRNRGASKGAAFALDEFTYTFVSREPKENAISYDQINETTFNNYQIIINATPVDKSKYRGIPLLPYEHFTTHIAFDLIYNPAETQFLKKAKDEGAKIKTATICLFLQKKHGKSGINKLHYIHVRKIPFKIYQGKYLNGILYKKSDPVWLLQMFSQRTNPYCNCFK
jgi:hypothetical protein